MNGVVNDLHVQRSEMTRVTYRALGAGGFRIERVISEGFVQVAQHQTTFDRNELVAVRETIDACLREWK